MAYSRPELFKWKRKTDPLEAARGTRKSNVKDWIKRVQDASEHAAREAFGSDIICNDHLREIVPDDEAAYEAQELLDGWLKERQFPDLHNELDYKDENWSSSTRLILNADSFLNNANDDADILSHIRNKYLDVGDNVLNFAVDDYSIEAQQDYANHILKLEDVDDDEIDESLMVQDVLQGMMSKQVVKDIDLGLKPLVKRVKDPLPKMNTRHQQVKERSETRRKKNAAKKQEKMSIKDIQQKAMEKIAQEEKGRIAREKREEKEIKLEMIKLRKEMKEGKRSKDFEIERKQKILDEAKLQIQKELKRQKEEEIKERDRIKRAEEKMRLQIQKEVEENSIQLLKGNMQILHKYFSTWYNVVVEHHISMGKARAVADWKCKLRAWNAWKAYVACVKSSQEARAIEKAMKEKYRKEVMAIHHNNRKLLHLFFTSWLKYARYRSEKKMLLVEHEQKTMKMAMFLEAAAQGLLWKEKEIKATHQNMFVDGAEATTGWEKHHHSEQEKEQQKSIETDIIKSSNVLTKDVSKKSGKEDRQYPDKSNTNDEGEDIKGSQNKKIMNSSSIKIRDSVPSSQENVDSVHVNKLETFSERFKQFQPSTTMKKARTDFSENRTKISVASSSSSSTTTTASRKPQIRSDKVATKPLHLAMEEREKQRRERRALLEEEKRKKEEEKLKELRARETERLRKEEAEKEEKIKQRKEQKRLEAQKEKEKQIRMGQFRVKNTLATNHYNASLLRRYGLEPWKRLIQISRLNIQISDKYRTGVLLRLVFIEWHNYTKKTVSEKTIMADHCYEQILTKRSFRSWQKCRFHLQNLNKMARKHSLARIVKRAFNTWQDYVTDKQILMWAKESSADEHDQMRMLKKYLLRWVKYVAIEKEGRVREKRKNELRRRVQTWLPDFKGGSEMKGS